MARIWTFGQDVDTDQILPGRCAPYMTSEAELPNFAFVDARPEFAGEVADGDVLVAGPNFGCGSSREYAASALAQSGLGAILAPSFARIFFRNATNLGLPLITMEASDLAPFSDGDEVELDLAGGRLVHAGGELRLPAPSAFARDLWSAGGLVSFYRETGRFPGEVVR